jgi:hypothetical protein
VSSGRFLKDGKVWFIKFLNFGLIFVHCVYLLMLLLLR